MDFLPQNTISDQQQRSQRARNKNNSNEDEDDEHLIESSVIASNNVENSGNSH
jgi:hypothetical protein